jgi:murein DD-endopeptidase MepM/ murein hydrolase activator NlpD
MDRLQNGGVHMDKRLFNKTSNFFKKEGFYVVLFLCLCVVATVAAISTKNNRAKHNEPVVQEDQQPDKQVALQQGSETKTEINNALEVKKETEPSKAISVPKEGTAAVAKTVDTKFAKPVDGTLARTYSTEPVISDTLGWYKTVNGIEIVTKVGTEVKAALDGKVEVVDNDKTELGQYVIINHQNGVKTVYANLDENLKVKVGDTVKKNNVIGTVGNTRASFSEEKFGSHLLFEVIKGKDYIDPAQYVKYTASTK